MIKRKKKKKSISKQARTRWTMRKLVKKESLSLFAFPIIPRELSFNSLSPLASLRHKEASMEGRLVTSLRSYYRNRSKFTFHTSLTESPIALIRSKTVVAFDWEIRV